MKILITGATHGIGKGVAKVLGSQSGPPNELILLGRTPQLSNSLVNELKLNHSKTVIQYYCCDLSKLADVKNTIEQIHSANDYLDVLFINAGIGYAPKQIITEDGFDAHFQVNYLAQFMLVLNLLNLLEKSPTSGRVVFNATKEGELDLSNLQLTEKWSYEKAIQQAMAAKRMMLRQLHLFYLHSHRQENALSFIGFHIDKMVWTNQVNHIPGWMKLIMKTLRFFGKFISIEENGNHIAPLLTEAQEMSLNRSGQLITWRNGAYQTISMQPAEDDQFWYRSVELLNDPATTEIALQLQKSANKGLESSE